MIASSGAGRFFFAAAFPASRFAARFFGAADDIEGRSFDPAFFPNLFFADLSEAPSPMPDDIGVAPPGDHPDRSAVGPGNSSGVGSVRWA